MSQIPKPALVLVAVALAAIVVLMARSARETEEDRARAAVRAVIAGVEAKEVPDALAPISERYHDADGLDRRALKGFLLSQLLDAHSHIVVAVDGEMAATVRKDGVATVVFYARLAEGAIQGFAGRGERWRFEVELEKEDGRWMIVTHRRERAQGL